MRYLKSKDNSAAVPEPAQIISQPLSTSLAENIKNLKELLQGCSDAVFKEFTQGGSSGLVIFFDGLVDKKQIELNLIKPILLGLKKTTDQDNVLKLLQDSVIAIAELHTLQTLQEVCHHISSGDTVLIIDGYGIGLVAGTRAWQSRGIQTPENEVVIRGPKEGFTETLRFNTALLRRRLKSTTFKMESMVIGRITKTDVVVGYIDSVAPAELVAQIKERLTRIDIDGVLDSGYLEEFLEDNPKSIFSQIEYTEKPDRICGHLLEGRVCIMVDGSPTALILPTSFPRFWIASEDYYEHFIFSSILRLLRIAAFVLALLLPSLYVAAITYHQEMIPTSLYLTIASTRSGVPFPAFVEALLLEFTFELLREAGIRLPRAVGPAVSIVGALIIGDAAVKAGLVSTPMVVIVAFTGIASFVAPSYNAGIIIRIARFGFLLAAAVLGLYGIFIALLIMLIRMVSLESFGVPYLSPLAPLRTGETADIIIRRPWMANTKRPFMKGMKNEIRQKTPDPADEEG